MTDIRRIRFNCSLSFFFFSIEGKRKITFVEFIRVMESLITDEEGKENGCIDALRVFDSDQRGYISLNELQVALRSMPGSAQMKEFELRDILQEADPDGDGKVKIQGEWISLMIKENVKRQTAYARDYFLGMASFMCALLQLPYHPGRV